MIPTRGPQAAKRSGIRAEQVSSSSPVGTTGTSETQIIDPLVALSEPRARATVSEFGDRLLVAGGENPFHEASRPARVLRDTAEIYDPSTHGFEPGLLKLVEPTTQHAAVTLDTGETVLIGGRIDAADASALVQIISPETRVAKLLKQLAVARTSPTVLRLDDGRLLVAGGTDASASPVAELEWRKADASAFPSLETAVSLPPRFDRAYVALAGGAALAVGGCAARPPQPGEDCHLWCDHGCPPEPETANRQRYDAYWISPEGQLSRLDFPINAGRPVLLPGSDGRPWLIAEGSVDDPSVRAHHTVYRFDPWQKAFSPVAVDLGLQESPGPLRFIATGPDAFAWLTRDDSSAPILRGVRLGARSRFSNDGRLVELRDPDDSRRPAHLVPDHPPGVELDYNSQTGTLSFAASVSACAWIADARFADFSASITFTSPTAPSLRIGAQLLSNLNPTAPDSACHLPAFDEEGGGSGGTLLLERRGSQLTTTIAGVHAQCALPEGRLPFAVCGSPRGATQIALITAKRSD